MCTFVWTYAVVRMRTLLRSTNEKLQKAWMNFWILRLWETVDWIQYLNQDVKEGEKSGDHGVCEIVESPLWSSDFRPAYGIRTVESVLQDTRPTAVHWKQLMAIQWRRIQRLEPDGLDIFLDLFSRPWVSRWCHRHPDCGTPESCNPSTLDDIRTDRQRDRHTDMNSTFDEKVIFIQYTTAYSCREAQKAFKVALEMGLSQKHGKQYVALSCAGSRSQARRQT